MVIAIDGPAASGKSSTAKWVADRLGMRHVDSGALYRAATAASLRNTADAASWKETDVVASARKKVHLVLTDRGFVPHMDGAEVDSEIRAANVTQHVSSVARMAGIRAWVNDLVREAARSAPVVVDGRDMGTAVFPDAELKVFLVADPWERARRRLVQQLQRAPTDKEIAEETERQVHRDARDAQQSAPAADAILIDTTYLTQEEQVNRIVELANAVTQRAAKTSAE